MSRITSTLTTQGMKCQGCVSAAKAALAILPGIHKVEIDLAEKLVTVEHDASVKKSDVAQVLNQAGFPSH